MRIFRSKKDGQSIASMIFWVMLGIVILAIIGLVLKDTLWHAAGLG